MLVDAAADHGRPHLVYISVVGAERVPVVGRVDRTMFGYFESKRTTEDVVASSVLPWTTLRATQFHDLVLFVLETMAKLPVVPVPTGVAFQPVEADEVAARLVELALGEPSGLVDDVAGPRVYSMKELVLGYLRATHRRRPLLPVRLPGSAARAIRAGANLAPEHAVGKKTWEEFLEDRLSRSASVHGVTQADVRSAGPRTPLGRGVGRARHAIPQAVAESQVRVARALEEMPRVVARSPEVRSRYRAGIRSARRPPIADRERHLRTRVARRPQERAESSPYRVRRCLFVLVRLPSAEPTLEDRNHDISMHA